jgi:uncharacterized protein (DUF849 family)
VDVKLLFENKHKVFHIHCYDENGNESLKPDDVNNLVSLVKSISPEIQLGISSGDWIEPDLAKRKAYIKGWINIPDFISVNMIEDDAIEISELLLSKGVKIEAGLNEKKAAEIFVESGLYKDCFIILIKTEFKNSSKAKADEEAIRVFSENLRQFLLSPPLGSKVTMAIDPGFRTVCKLVCLDQQENLLHHDAIYPHPPQPKVDEAAEKIKGLLKKYADTVPHRLISHLF